MRPEGEIRFPKDWRLPMHENCGLVDAQQEWISWIRQVRGAILTGAYEIERNLGGFIEFHFLGGRASIAEVRSMFEDQILGALSFDRQINIAVEIARQMFPKPHVSEIQGRLNTLKTLRNAMAHNPCWFEPYMHHKSKTVRLKPMIMCGKKQLHMADDWHNGVSKEIIALIEITSQWVHSTLEKARQEEKLFSA